MLAAVLLRPSIALALLAGSALAGEWPAGIAERMGLQTPAGARLEVRVWIGGGIAHPFRLVRIWETADGVAGESLAWSTATDNRRIRRLMNRRHCAGPLAESDGVMWCSTGQSTQWESLLADLKPSRLWDLPTQESLGARPCFVEDGEIVTIELIAGDRHHRVAYSNPDWCCRWEPCAVASHVRSIVGRVR